MRKRSEWKLHESWDAVAAAVDGVSLSGWRCIQAITPVSKLSMVGSRSPGLQMVGRVMLFALQLCSRFNCGL
jgi:hypothetical protein